MLAENAALSELDVSRNQLLADGATGIGRGLMANEVLSVLWLYGNGVLRTYMHLGMWACGRQGLRARRRVGLD